MCEKRARKVSNVPGEVHFKQKQMLTISFTGNTLPHRKLSRSGVTCTCNLATLEAEFRNDVGSIPVLVNSPSIGGWIV